MAFTFGLSHVQNTLPALPALSRYLVMNLRNVWNPAWEPASSGATRSSRYDNLTDRILDGKASLSSACPSRADELPGAAKSTLPLAAIDAIDVPVPLHSSYSLTETFCEPCTPDLAIRSPLEYRLEMTWGPTQQ